MTNNASSTRGLLDINRFVIPSAVLDETLLFLQHVGQKGCEGFVLWSGKQTDVETFRFSTAVIPAQRAFSTGRGLLVVVDGEALFRVNKEAYERNELLGGQIHTHPTDAYHSVTDDHYPLVTLLGALSVVVPDFAANAPKDIAYWAGYRVSGPGTWSPLADSGTFIIE